MKKFLLIIALLMQALCLLAEDNSIYRLVPGKEYYIWNSTYERPLALSADQSQPRLVNYAENDMSQYVFVAEETPTSGYVLLRHKATGRYLAASTSNTYSVLAQSSKGTGTEYQWLVKPGTKGHLVNKKSTSKALGVDTGETADYIGVWYDKTQGTSTTLFEVYEVSGNIEQSRKAYAIKELQNVTDYISNELSDIKYELVLRRMMEKSVTRANQWLANTEAHTTTEILDKVQVLRDSLMMFTPAESSVLLTANDMSSFGTSFSLALSELKLDTAKYPGDSIYVLLRNKEGLGKRISINEDGNYVFVMQNGAISVYKDGTLKDNHIAYFVPITTAQGDEAEWTIIRKSRMTNSLPELLSETTAVTKGGGVVVDKYGKNTRTIVNLTNTKWDINEQLDLHIISEDNALKGCKINLNHEKAWLIFDNTIPSDVISNYLSQVYIFGERASTSKNCRVVIYLNGAVIIPFKTTDCVFTGYDGEQYTSTETNYRVGMYKELGKDANRIRSFRLKRGYMATLASGTNGSGYSRVYVADHEDIEVPVLPNALYGRISSITIKKWQYVSKKGYCSTKDNGSIASDTKKIRATWYYTWSADRSSSNDTEYIPIRQHKWWPSISQIADHEESTACLSINEPEHSEQHNNCDCGGAIDEWTACTLTPDFQQTGMRIGSPAPTDEGWLKTYISNCNNMAYRCDFVAIHAYWGSNECNDGKAWYNRLKAIYDATKRPIWVTEWAYGASWTSESWPSGWDEKLEQNRWRILDIQQKLEEAPFVERYAYYQWDTQFRNLVDWSSGNITPAGRVYRDMKSDFAYNASVQFTPVWWTPSLKNVSMQTNINEADETLAIEVTNPNTDCTNILKIQKYNSDNGEWEDYYTETDRSLFDNETIKYEFPLNDFNYETDQLRVYVKRTVGDETMSAGTSTGYLINPNIYATSMTSVEGWKFNKSAANGYTKATGDTYLEVWDATATGMQFDYFQNVENLPDGIYTLSAKVFNSSNGVKEAKVNGNVVLYVQCDTIQYMQPVTKDSEIEEAETLQIPGIIVRNGTMRVGIKNIGEMTARWAGADDFKLIRTGEVPSSWEHIYYNSRIEQDAHTRELFFVSTEDNKISTADIADASAFVINPKAQRKDNYAWSTSNCEFKSGESADGVSSNSYWDLWKNSAYNSSMAQNIYYLPEGQYAVNALLRGSSDADKISLTAIVLDANGNAVESTSEDEQKTATALLSPTGNVSEEGSIYKNGWQLVETDFVVVRPGETLKISMNANFTKTGWWSADNFGLTWKHIDPIMTRIEDKLTYQNTPNQSKKILYDLQGRKLDSVTRNGIYIINGKKVVK